MKFNTIILICLFLFILSISTVNANENLNNITSQDSDMLSLEDSSIIADEDTTDTNDTSYTEVAIKIPNEVEIGSNEVLKFNYLMMQLVMW